jgi:hypothetical protein
MHVYRNNGRQKPVFLPSEGESAQFFIEAGGEDEVTLEYSFDPRRVRLTERLWESFEGGWAGQLAGPPTAIRVNIKQATGPVFLWVKVGRRGEKDA